MSRQKVEKPVKYDDATMTLSSVIARDIWAKQTKNIMKTYTVAITNKALTECMAKKLSSSNLTFENLKKISKILGKDGLFNTLMAKQADSKPRVTNAKRVIEKIYKYIYSTILITYVFYCSKQCLVS